MSNTLGPPATGLGWDVTHPLVGAAHGLACYEIQDLRKGVGIRSDKEHQTLAASGAGGEHKQGSAISWYTGTQPTVRPDGATDLTSADLGRLWYDTTNNVLMILDTIGTPDVFSVCYDILDEDDMATDSATRPPSQQSVKAYIDSGTVTMAAKTLTSPVLDGTLSGTAFIDENDMASDSAIAVASQQSIKAYVTTVDAANSVTDQAYADGVGTAALAAAIAALALGTRTFNDADTDALAKDVVYLAGSDGFVTAWGDFGGEIVLLSDSAALPSVEIDRNNVAANDYSGRLNVHGQIKSGEYFKITATAAITATWLPIGTGTLSK